MIVRSVGPTPPDAAVGRVPTSCAARNRTDERSTCGTGMNYYYRRIIAADPSEPLFGFRELPHESSTATTMY